MPRSVFRSAFLALLSALSLVALTASSSYIVGESTGGPGVSAGGLMLVGGDTASCILVGGDTTSCFLMN